MYNYLKVHLLLYLHHLTPALVIQEMKVSRLKDRALKFHSLDKNTVNVMLRPHIDHTKKACHKMFILMLQSRLFLRYGQEG